MSLDKVYVGVKPDPEGWPGKVWVTLGPRQYPLEHHVKHSPDGYSWGYGGSGPSELAKDILWDLLGEEQEPSLYHDFKDSFIATLPQDEGFIIPATKIRDWLRSRVIPTSVPAQID